ncbi:MAG: TonB-dependent receptor [Ignavibacteria bacterium RBG_16_34_14]|nr:MAG: TonB-dependent receptor [Ignavibacteria bacterium RBG_16_34_14]
MKYLIILFFILNDFVFTQNIIRGKVTDSETNKPLSKANVVLEGAESKGTSTNEDGSFILENVFPGNKIVISYVGYNSQKHFITKEVFDSTLSIKLTPKIIPAQTVLIEASLGEEGITPITFEKVRRKEIEENYTVQDIPQFLSYLPSTTFYSEGGNGIGYNYLSIRGFDQRRITVSINGIPQNDPEDHNVYWLDFPDLLASTELIQVQRGAGSGVLGYPAIGGSINIITSVFSNKPKAELSVSIGSYNTRKYSASFSSGLINEKYSVYAKLGQILSSGYRNNSWVKFNSYHISAVRYDENFTTQVNFFGGPIEDGLAYTGLPKFTIKDKELRKANYSDWGADADNFTYVVPRRPTEIENFFQPHYELLNELQLNDNLTFNSALFLVIGKGFFDYDAYWYIYYDDYFRLRESGYDTSFVPSNPLIRAQVENIQYGWIPRISWKHKNGELIFGIELRFHKSDHWGRIQYANSLPPGYDLNRYYYFYNGSKDIISGFVHESYKLNDKINILGELQIAYHKYKIFNEKYAGTEFSVDDIFFNPRAGINYSLSPYQNIYFSFARVTREPRLKNYYDAAESSAGKVPQFGQNPYGSYNFDNPFVKPEAMNDFEIGTSFNTGNLNVSLNVFYMLFNDEIVANGQVDRFGQPVTGNIDKTVHQGIEVSVLAKLFNNLEIFGNATYSKNTIDKGNTFIEYYVTEDSTTITKLNLDGNKISSFPDFLANFGINFRHKGLYLKLTGKFVGDFYSDNYDESLASYLNQYPGFASYSDNKNEAYFAADFFGSYEFNLFNALTQSKVFVQVNNIFDNLYSAFAIGKEFFPAAERNFLVGLQVGL